MTDDINELRQEIIEATTAHWFLLRPSLGPRIIAAFAAAREQAKRYRDALETVETAWAYSWDCSRDPGHPLMKQAMEVAEAALARDDGGNG